MVAIGRVRAGRARARGVAGPGQGLVEGAVVGSVPAAAVVGTFGWAFGGAVVRAFVPAARAFRWLGAVFAVGRGAGLVPVFAADLLADFVAVLAAWRGSWFGSWFVARLAWGIVPGFRPGIVPGFAPLVAGFAGQAGVRVVAAVGPGFVPGFGWRFVGGLRGVGFVPEVAGRLAPHLVARFGSGPACRIGLAAGFGSQVGEGIAGGFGSPTGEGVEACFSPLGFVAEIGEGVVIGVAPSGVAA